MHRNILKAQFNVSVDKSLLEEVREYHVNSGKTLAALVADALIEYMQNHPKGEPSKAELRQRVFRTSDDKDLKSIADALAERGKTVE